MIYTLVCRECNYAPSMPFTSAEDRGKWAAVHTTATGHDRWIVGDDDEGGDYVEYGDE